MKPSPDQPDLYRAPLIEPVAYRPAVPAPPARRRRPPRIPRWAPGAAALAAVVLAALWFLSTARSVRIDIDPKPERIEIKGGVDVALGDRWLIRPGRYTLIAAKQGYQALRTSLTIGSPSDQSFHFRLEKLPGLLSVRSQPPATLSVDGKILGRTPLQDLRLAPGAHRLTLRAPRYVVYETQVTIEGAGKRQALQAKLVPGWAPVSFRSKPAQAELSVDGDVLGRTPLSVELGAGAHRASLRLPGYKTWQQTVTVAADTPLSVPEVMLARADGTVKLVSTPAGASVAVDGDYRGQTPLELALSPGKPHHVQVSKAGYAAADRNLEVTPQQRRDLTVDLTPILGVVELSVEPADATLYVDGQQQPRPSGRIELTAVTHKLELRKPGYEPFTTTLTPRPGFEQRLHVVLHTPAEARLAALPAVLTTAAGQKLRLIQPGRFTMGSPRGSQGRRANEVLRPVVLTRPYYLGATEVTNAQFRQFDPQHTSGIVGRQTLDNEDQPVVRVSWEQAARYCNWLSARDHLPPAYRDNGGHLELIAPVATGYRLPTEAEWAWAARFAGEPRPLRYPWGQQMPPRGRAGNYAGKEAAALVARHLDDYDDGYPATAPVASFAANALGLYDLGGNVAEWVNDAYEALPLIGAPERTDPLGPTTGSDHVIRGSSWMDSSITALRLSARDSGNGPRPDLGFRIARYAQ
ncbi:MAG: PEGA domain-containing protein [Gammaproteobacteria bacterium]|nr:PEGA domain-containing protein [Gammaproteobacteria bacterium]